MKNKQLTQIAKKQIVEGLTKAIWNEFNAEKQNKKQPYRFSVKDLKKAISSSIDTILIVNNLEINEIKSDKNTCDEEKCNNYINACEKCLKKFYKQIKTFR